MSETTKNLKCPRCGSTEKYDLWDKRYKCKNCGLIYTEDQSTRQGLSEGEEAEIQRQADIESDLGREDSQADGLMTLGGDDIIFPEEF